MADYPIVDSHVHTYPSAQIGLQAMMGTGRAGYSGTVEELLDAMERGGIDKAVMVNMTPVTEMFDAAVARLPDGLSPQDREREEQRIGGEMIGRLRRRNAWTCEVAREHPRLVPFIGLDPTMSAADLVAEIDTRHGEGAHGIKLHPPNQRFYPNDGRLWPAYERAQALGMPIIYHSGTFSLGVGRSDHGHPKHFREVAAAFPRLPLVLGHLAFGDFEACAALAREFSNVFFDCCYVINSADENPSITDEQAVAGFRLIGVDRVMFGSDFPWFDPVGDSARIHNLPLEQDEARAVLHENARRILGL